MTTTAKCRHCGATFTASRGGTTVHCPAHRTAASRRPVCQLCGTVSGCFVCRPPGCFVCYGSGNLEFHPTLAPTAVTTEANRCHRCGGTGRAQ